MEVRWMEFIRGMGAGRNTHRAGPLCVTQQNYNEGLHGLALQIETNVMIMFMALCTNRGTEVRYDLGSVVVISAEQWHITQNSKKSRSSISDRHCIIKHHKLPSPLQTSTIYLPVSHGRKWKRKT